MKDNRTPMVEIRAACFKYGTKDIVLNNVDLTVKTNEIYGLLGPSGCGKTTILRCILGMTLLDSGSITVNVQNRCNIGYMPQEAALFPEFTMKEIFVFYGRMFGLSIKRITERSKELCYLLDLPEWNNTFGSLSGGQQRRTSFAVAILHNPQLLILDEPTVGVDSLLAHSMREYLISLTAQGKTVIITTHYIEEAKQCNTISLMRGGRILSESSPCLVVENQNSVSLEEAFLKLCQRQENETTVSSGSFNSKKKSGPPIQNDVTFNGNRFFAQLIKNVYWVKRNVPIMVFLLSLPALQSFLFCASFGQDPQNLHVAFISEEHSFTSNLNYCHDSISSNFSRKFEDCNFTSPFTCQYVKELQKKMNLVLYNRVEYAVNDVIKNKVWGVIHLPSNFTTALLERTKHVIYPSEYSLEHGIVAVTMDMSNYIIGHLLKKDITSCLTNAITHFISSCGFSAQFASVPIKIEAVFGSNNPVFAHSGLPGFICSFCFYFTMMFTTGAVFMEKIIGLLERSRVAGMTHFEIVGAHLVVQFSLMAAQTAIMLFVFYFCYSNPLIGDIKLLISILFSIEVVGIAYGFFLNEVFETERMVTYASIGSTLAVFSLGGIIWPIEGAHITIKYLTWAFPIVPAMASYNSVSNKGYNISNLVVLQGFASCFFWAATFSILACIIARYKKDQSFNSPLRGDCTLQYCKAFRSNRQCLQKCKINENT